MSQIVYYCNGIYIHTSIYIDDYGDIVFHIFYRCIDYNFIHNNYFYCSTQHLYKYIVNIVNLLILIKHKYRTQDFMGIHYFDIYIH